MRAKSTHLLLVPPTPQRTVGNANGQLGDTCRPHHIAKVKYTCHLLTVCGDNNVVIVGVVLCHLVWQRLEHRYDLGMKPGQDLPRYGVRSRKHVLCGPSRY